MQPDPYLTESMSPEDDAILARGTWFASLPADLQESLRGAAVAGWMPQAATIYSQDAPAQGLFLLLDGRLHLQRDLPDRRVLLFHVAEPGFWFGEMGALSSQPPYLSAVAVVDSRLLSISRAALEALVEREPRWFEPLSRLWFFRELMMMRILEQWRLSGTVERVAARLSILADIRRHDRGSERPVLLNLTQAELGQLSDLSRQHTNRALRTLANEGLVTLRQGQIAIPDPVALAERPRHRDGF